MVILVVKLGAIGDVLRTTFILPGLKEKYPGCRIDWLTSKMSRDVLLNNSLIDRLLVWEDLVPTMKLPCLPAGRSVPFPSSYDLVIGLEDEKIICDFVGTIKSQQIVGAYSIKGQQTYTPSAWFDMSFISKYGLEMANELKKNNQKTYQQHLAELLGIKVSPYVFKLTQEEIAYGKKVVREKGLGVRGRIIGINTGAGKRWPLKSWGIEQTIELIKRLKNELSLTSLILGGSEEQERNQLISKATDQPDAGNHSLRHFASIINQCSAILSSDSLAMHFAIALKKPLVVLFGPTSAAEIELYGLGEKLSAPLDCTVCYKKGCEIKPNCLETLSVETVLEAIRRLR